jgi:hypothetical protein
MPTLADVLIPMLKKLERRLDKSTGIFEVVTASPLTVYLNGDETTAVPAVGIPAETYTVGLTGRYFLDQGQLPLCFPTSTTP